MTQLTPYDTGQRCEALPWLPLGTKVTETTPAENFGKVDFDDDCGDTICTVYVERMAQDGSYQLHVAAHTDENESLRVVIDGDTPCRNVEHRVVDQTKLAALLAANCKSNPHQLARIIAEALAAGDLA